MIRNYQDENALLDIDDFIIPLLNYDVDDNKFTAMGKISKRSHVKSSSPQALDIDDDSGFCGSNLTPPKMPKYDDELLNELINEKEPIENVEPRAVCSGLSLVNNGLMNGLNKLMVPSLFKPKSGRYEIKILAQPEEQHRARYLTEGSRGAIKDRSGNGHPVIKIFGYNKSPVKVECFIGHDKQLGSPHLFYQASKICGKNSTRCTSSKVDGTTVIVMEATPENDMQISVDCIGILKERNVDVEQKLLRMKIRGSDAGLGGVPIKKRSTRCRLVFRCQIPNSNEVLQVVSSPVLCTQPLGTPEICKKSLSKCPVSGNQELFIIGKNFLKDSKVIWKNKFWTKVVEPDKEYLHSTHLVCTVPPYDGSDFESENTFPVTLSIKSGGKTSDDHAFTYYKTEELKANSMANMLNGTQQVHLGTTGSSFLVSSLQKPFLLTMMSNSVPNDAKSEFASSMSFDEQTQLTSDEDSLSRHNQESVLSATRDFVDESSVNSCLSNITSQCNSPLQFKFSDSTQFPSFSDKIRDSRSNDGLAFSSQSNTCPNQIVIKSETLPQRPVDNFSVTTSNSNSSQALINSIESKPIDGSIDSVALSNSQLSEATAMMQIHQSPLTVSMTSLSEHPSTVDQSLINPDPNVSSLKKSSSELSVNQIFNSANTVMTQASNINALSEMSENELLRFINPDTFI